ncbi:MAG: UDP-N-acetylglucosamine pyrophosphorylase [Bacillota bacterium]
MNNKTQNELTNIALFDLTKTIASPLFEITTYPHEVLPLIAEYIIKIGKTLDKTKYFNPEEGVHIHFSAKIDKSATIIPPAIICENAEIRKSAYLRGSAIIGANSVVGNSVEVKNSIIFDGVQIPHFNYVGDSIFGENSHMGAGSVTSNVKADKQNVVIKTKNGNIATNRKKVGAFVGGNAEIGCNVVLNPGTVIGKNTTVQPLASVRGYICENSICKKNGEVVKKQ